MPIKSKPVTGGTVTGKNQFLTGASDGNNHSKDLTVSDWRPFAKNTLLGFFVITMSNGMRLHDCMLHRTADGSRWIGFSSREYADATGNKQYARIIGFTDRGAQDRFRDAVLQQLDELIEDI